MVSGIQKLDESQDDSLDSVINVSKQVKGCSQPLDFTGFSDHRCTLDLT